ncbi:phosphoribosyl-AMP cyclohydrolase [Mucisphaera calidilacus]|uniref:Phosphoribosyl-AMP cyclohydrolase n=1 Tax=Mucisphaera calidilacus TaxID=2527982 RepID=A0A518BY37_9BACT|nr:phosphoribosyl-AMP cyclohydrolase [Mucisphaera calidilacus]QDU71899.1 phosphoribosyl-AMP cyclohydrolase [Mucisphaera calidilacus]
MSDNARETGTDLDLKLNDQGLIPAILQDHETGEVLMMAWMNRDALDRTIESKKATFYSRSRDKTWVKGESSGHIQEIVEVRIDCDQDTVLLRCKSHGPACHVGYHTCFYRTVQADGLSIVEKPVFDPDAVYKK